MIKHLPEGMVPFMDCGFERSPYLPLLGQTVRVGCQVVGLEAVPVLTLRRGDEEWQITSQPAADNCFQFSLGAFEEPGIVSYRFTAGAGSSPWYAFDPLTETRYTQAQQILKTQEGFALVLDRDLVLHLNEDATLVLTSQAALGHPVPEAALDLAAGIRLSAEQGALWQLKRLSQPLATALTYTVRRNGKGHILSSSLEMDLPARHILGTGERFDAVDQQGLGSNGRVVEKFTHQGDMAYIPIPFFMTDSGLGWYREGGIPSEMAFKDKVTISQRAQGELLSRDRLLFGHPSALLKAFIGLTGDMALPPEWAFGVWISGNGWKDDGDVDAQLAALERHQYPASVMVLEQWSDEQTFYRWHSEHFPKPSQTVQRIREAGLHLLLWQIPVLKQDDVFPHSEVHQVDIREAIQEGYVIRRADGSPYRINGLWFQDSLLPDFTNPAACKWWFDKRKHLLDMGVEGFKTDGGEFLFEEDARLFDGSTGLTAHNRYPGQYIGAYQDFLREHQVQGLTFSRAGYLGCQTQPAHWAGDQQSTWPELQAQLRAGISAGLSGISFWGFDIGGFAGPLPDKELYLRATALACFCPIMQWHAETPGGQYGGERVIHNDRSPWNLAEQLKDPQALDISCAFARLRETLRPYLWQEAQYGVQQARPLMAHLCLDYTEDPLAWEVHDQYLLGRQLLVAPVVEPGAQSRSLYLPKGRWEDYFTGEVNTGSQTITVDAPLDRIPVFKKLDS